jgi:hypothetical protein
MARLVCHCRQRSSGRGAENLCLHRAVSNAYRSPDWMAGNKTITPSGRTPMDVSVATALEKTTLRKVYLRLVPYCFLLYILCYVDRINVSFAALTMNRELGLSAYVYGLAAGAFF